MCQACATAGGHREHHFTDVPYPEGLGCNWHADVVFYSPGPCRGFAFLLAVEHTTNWTCMIPMKSTKEVDLALALDGLRILAHQMNLRVTQVYMDNDGTANKVQTFHNVNLTF